MHEFFYRFAPGAPGSRRRSALKLAQHVPDMLRYRRRARAADVVHFQWFALEPLDAWLAPGGRPLVYTAHNAVRPERRPGGARAQRRLYERADAIVVHSEHARSELTDGLGLDPGRVEVIPHGAFDYLTRLPHEHPLPEDLAAVEGPVVLCFGLMRPYKGIDVLLEAWGGIERAELWVVGAPRMDIAPLRAAAPAGVRFVPRCVPDPGVPAVMRRADLVVLPYRRIDQSGVLFAALAFGRPLLLTAVGGFPDVAATGAAVLVPPEDPPALHAELAHLLEDEGARAQLAAAAQAAAAGPYAWAEIGRRTHALYRGLV